MRHISECGTQSLLYELFAEGLLFRIRRDTHSDLGLDHRILSMVKYNTEMQLHVRDTPQSQTREIIITGT